MQTTTRPAWMSWFSSIFPEPYDARQRASISVQQRPNAVAQLNAVDAVQDSTQEPSSDRPDWLRSARSRKQFTIFAAGATFFAISTLITRRALLRKYLQTRPAGTFSPSNNVRPVNGGIEAFEALTLATLNVFSLTVMLSGGTLWAMDISSLDDLRTIVRKRMDVTGGVRSPEQAEEEIEEWMAVVMTRVQGKTDQQVADMIKQAGERGRNDKTERSS